jgi:hypothetical protein
MMRRERREGENCLSGLGVRCLCLPQTASVLSSLHFSRDSGPRYAAGQSRSLARGCSQGVFRIPPSCPSSRAR